MSNNVYEERVKLLITVLPVINEYQQLALKGGTAINLFVQQGMPRMSVDIDLVMDLCVNKMERKMVYLNVNLPGQHFMFLELARNLVKSIK